jgi:polysaccharide export outer membrane protein
MTMSRRALRVSAWLAAAAICLAVVPAVAQSNSGRQGQTQSNGSKPAQPAATPAQPVAGVVTPPPDYVIGPEDVLLVLFWRDKEISTETTVRPDGKISLLLVNEVQAAGLTPEELRQSIMKAAAAQKLFTEEPTVSVGVKQINSRKVYITGAVGKPGPYLLNSQLDVVQLITMAGGLSEYAKSENIQLIRTENGTPKSYRINYKEIQKGKNLAKNLMQLKPGDKIIVPE